MIDTPKQTNNNQLYIFVTREKNAKDRLLILLYLIIAKSILAAKIQAVK
jgi:hypothetical protein